MNCNFTNNCGKLYPQNMCFQPGPVGANLRGATGPTGPTGPTGASGIMTTAFFTAPQITGAQPTLLLENSFPTNQTDITFAQGNQINIAPGTYLMRFGSTVTSTNGTPPTISVSVNNVVEGGTIRTGVAFGSASLTGDALLTIPTQSVLSFETTVAPELTYDENFLIISKLG